MDGGKAGVSHLVVGEPERGIVVADGDDPGELIARHQSSGEV